MPRVINFHVYLTTPFSFLNDNSVYLNTHTSDAYFYSLAGWVLELR